LENLVRPVTPPTPEEIDEIVMMLRVLMIPQVILGISTFVSSALNVMQRFVVPQLAPLFYNFGRITAIFVFIPFLGRSPWVLVWGTILGSLAHLLIQIPLTRHLNIKYMPVLDLQDKYFRSMIKLGLPRILGLSAEEIAIGVDRVIAYSLIDYSLTAYELAIRLIVIPMSLFGLTFSIASFPALSRAYIQKNDELFSSIFIRILNQIFFMALPVTVMLLVLRLPITRLFYGILGSNFTWDDTRKVAWVVMFFAVGLTFESIRSFLYKTFYAIHDSRTPLFAAIFVVVGGIVTGILFTNYFSHFDELSVAHLTFNVDYFFDRSNGKAAVGGLALSSSLIYTIESISLMFILNKKYLKLSVYKFVGPLLLKSAIASATAVLAYFLYTLYNDILDTTKTSQIILLTSTTVFASASFYLWLSFLLNVREVEMIEKLVAKIFRVIFRR